MSSMDRISLTFASILASTALASTATSAMAQQVSLPNSAGDQIRAQMVAQAPTRADAAVDRWRYLSKTDGLSFDDYAGFVLANPDFPMEARLRTYAEDALDRDPVSPEKLVAYFDAKPPLTNSGLARYALALATLNRPEAPDYARKAWRGGEMSGPAEAYITGLFGSRFSAEDHDARMDALLWQGKSEAAARQIVNVSPAYRDIAMARLALLQGQDPAQAGLTVPASASSDPGYVYNVARQYRNSGQSNAAVSLLANRPAFSRPAVNAEAFVAEMLANARNASARDAVRIAASADDLFAPGADISTMSYRLRDDYTSLMWLGGTNALYQLGDGNAAAPLFYRYGAAAQTPQTRSKGFYWAGNASARAGNAAEANRYFEMAAEYPEYYYGLLALERLGRSVPSYAGQTLAVPTQEERAAFISSPLVQAIRSLSRGGSDWQTARYFYTALADSADTPGELALAGELASGLNLPELGVVVGRVAPEKNFSGFTEIGFPTLSTPQGANWTFVHAIARQESEFDETRVSHAGARGLMQLMPGTAREQAGKLGMNYMSSDLIGNPTYNLQLGTAYFDRMLNYYGGSYPLAVAAYNAGPGNVNKWLRQNGDPREGNIDWLRWIEEIPFFETKNYVQRVLENAVVYEAMNPGRAEYGRPRTVSQFLGKAPG